MLSQKRRDTACELQVRQLVHAAGLRYRVDYQPLPELRRRADLVFTKSRVAVFVDGCFWHGCKLHRALPKSNSDWWAEKIERNRRRDSETTRILRSRGWK